MFFNTAYASASISASLVSYGLYRVKHRGFLGRVPTEEHSGERANRERHEYGPWLNVDRPSRHQQKKHANWSEGCPAKHMMHTNLQDENILQIVV